MPNDSTTPSKIFQAIIILLGNFPEKIKEDQGTKVQIFHQSISMISTETSTPPSLMSCHEAFRCDSAENMKCKVHSLNKGAQTKKWGQVLCLMGISNSLGATLNVQVEESLGRE